MDRQSPRRRHCQSREGRVLAGGRSYSERPNEVPGSILFTPEASMAVSTKSKPKQGSAKKSGKGRRVFTFGDEVVTPAELTVKPGTGFGANLNVLTLTDSMNT